MNNIINNKDKGQEILNQEIRVLLEEHLSKVDGNHSSDDFDKLIKTLKPYQNKIKLLETYSSFLEAQINQDAHNSNEALRQLVDLLDNYYQERLKTENQNNNFDTVDISLAKEKRNLKKEAQTLTNRKLNLLLQQHCWGESSSKNPTNWARMIKFEREALYY